MVIGWSLFITSDYARINGTTARKNLRAASAPGQPAQARPCPLSDLAVLLVGPAIPPAELRTAHLQVELRRKHEPLIGSEHAHELTDPLQFDPQRNELVNFNTAIEHMFLSTAEDALGQRLLEGGLGAAASLDRPATILDTRHEALLQHSGYVQAVGEWLALPGAHHHLQGSLTEAVLKVLSSQATSVDPQQSLTPRAHHERDEICGIFTWPARRDSGRHASMSSPTRVSPPCQ